MKNTKHFRNQIKKEVIKTLSDFQQSSKDGTFTIGMVIMRCRLLTSIERYNTNIKINWNNNFILSDELVAALKEIKNKYSLRFSNNYLIDLASDTKFKSIYNSDAYFTERFDEGFKMFNVLNLKNKLENNLVINGC